jgi:O-antigen/teichoic acid export membrane protein
MQSLKQRGYDFLRSTEKYAKTDMVYLAKGGFWLTFGQGLSSLAGFALSIGFANLLTQQTYGVYKYILSIGGIIGIFSLSGLSSALVRATAKNKDGTFLKMFWISIKWGVIVAILGAGVSAYYFYKGNSIFAIGILIVGACTPLIDSLELYGAFLNGKKDFRRSGIYRSVRSIVTSIGMIALLFLTNKALFLIIGYFFLHICSLAFLFKKTTDLHITNNEVDSEAFHLAKHTSIMTAFASFAERIDNILVFQFLGPAQLAIYNFAQVIPVNLAGFLKNISALATPKYAIQEKELAKKSLLQKSFKIFLLSLLMVIFYIVLAPLIYSTFFPSYIESVAYSQLYALIILFSGGLPVALLDAHIAIKEKYVVTIISGLQKIIILFIGVYFWGLWGLIIARVLTKLIAVGLSFVAAKKI